MKNPKTVAEVEAELRRLGICLDLAPADSPTFTGIPTAPKPSPERAWETREQLERRLEFAVQEAERRGFARGYAEAVHEIWKFLR